jgi:hypothetical protein
MLLLCCTEGCVGIDMSEVLRLPDFHATTATELHRRRLLFASRW